MIPQSSSVTDEDILLRSDPDAPVSYTISLVRFIPYDEINLPAQPVPPSGPAGGPIGWVPPRLLLSTDDSLWLSHTLGAYDALSDQLVSLPLPAEVISRLDTLVLPDGFLVASASEQTDDSITFTHFTRKPSSLWQQTVAVGVSRTPEDSRHHFTADRDGTVYFFTGRRGKVLRINIETGAITEILRFSDSFIPVRIWALDGSIYWYQFHQDSLDFSWHRFEVATQTERTQTHIPRAVFLSAVQSPLENGGAFIFDLSEIIWMNPDGSELQRLNMKRLPSVTWQGQMVMTQLAPTLHPQRDGSYLYVRAREEGVYILRLRVAP